MKNTTAKNGSTLLGRRETADGVTILLWSDGQLTNRLGGIVRGGKVPMVVLWTLADELSLFDWNELPAIIGAAKKIAKRATLPADPAAFRKALIKLARMS